MAMNLLQIFGERDCSCPEDSTDKAICYVESTEEDKQTSLNTSELTENVWYMLKPPKKFQSGHEPLVSARQILMVRQKLKAKWKKETEDAESPKKVSTVNRAKRRLAASYLSRLHI